MLLIRGADRTLSTRSSTFVVEILLSRCHTTCIRVALQESSKVCEHALISYEGRDVGADSCKNPENYKIGLIILQDTVANKEGSRGAEVGVEGQKAVLRLQFYLILTSSQLMFPRQTLDRGVFVSRTKSGKAKSRAGVLSNVQE